MKTLSLFLRTSFALLAFILLIAVNNALASSAGEVFAIAATLSENAAKLSNIGSIMNKSMSISDDSRDKAFLKLATNELKVALLVAMFSGDLLGATQLVKQDEKKSFYPQIKDSLREVALTALIENKEFFSDALKGIPNSKHSQLCRDANNLIENSISLIKAGIDRLD